MYYDTNLRKYVGHNLRFDECKTNYGFTDLYWILYNKNNEVLLASGHYGQHRLYQICKKKLHIEKFNEYYDDTLFRNIILKTACQCNGNYLFIDKNLDYIAVFDSTFEFLYSIYIRYISCPENYGNRSYFTITDSICSNIRGDIYINTAGVSGRQYNIYKFNEKGILSKKILCKTTDNYNSNITSIQSHNLQFYVSANDILMIYDADLNFISKYNISGSAHNRYYDSKMEFIGNNLIIKYSDKILIYDIRKINNMSNMSNTLDVIDTIKNMSYPYDITIVDNKLLISNSNELYYYDKSF